MPLKLYFTALAARTAVGKNAEMCAAAVRAGISRVGDHPFMLVADGQPLACGRESTLPATERGAARLARLTELALDELDMKLPKVRPSRIPTWLAVPSFRPGFDEAEARTLEHRLRARLGESMTLLPQGHVAAALGLRAARDAIAAGTCDIAIVGGVESYLDGATLAWLDAERRLSCASNRGGFPPGEGAAFVALASEDAIRELRLTPMVRVAEVAVAREKADEASEEGVSGIALSEVYEKVARSLSGTGDRFDDVYIDINGERARTTDFGLAMLRCGQLFRDESYVSVVGRTGELGAAAMVLHWILSARAWSRGYARGDHALVSSASWNGLRSAALLANPSSREK
jgi:3-oxoacyl-[acyl-carrier-protein] synthase I